MRKENARLLAEVENHNRKAESALASNSECKRMLEDLRAQHSDAMVSVNCAAVLYRDADRERDHLELRFPFFSFFFECIFFV